MSRGAAPVALAWGLRLVGVLCFACWLVPHDSYEASEHHERATFALGWPTRWYETEVRVDAGVIAHPPDLVIRKRPWVAKGPTGIWSVKPGAVEEFPTDLPAFTGWNSAVCVRRTRTNLLYGPLVPTVIGIGCWYVAGRLGRSRRTVPGARASDASDSPPTPV